jgi:hypothetical protein
MSTTRCTSPIALLLALAALSQSALAQPEDREAARPLFDEGRALAAQGHYAEACPRLEQAAKLFAGSGLLLNLGDCYEHIGRTASAWATFGDAAAAAVRAKNTDAEAEANRRRALVEPKLTRVVLQVSGDAPGLTLTLDGHGVGRAQWGAPIPVDPGPQDIRAEAPGFRPWSSSQTIDAPAGTMTVAVPALSPIAPEMPAPVPSPVAPPPAAAAPTAPATEPAPASPMGAPKILGLVAGGVGVAGLAVGSAFGFMSISQKNQQQSTCGSTPTCTGADHAQAVSDHSSAVTDGLVSTVGIVAGGALLVGGAVLFFAIPGRSDAGVQVTPSVGANGGGLSLSGSF